MNEKLFSELVDSVKEAGAIYRGDKEASRRFNFSPPDVKAIREKTGLSQVRFAMVMGVSVRTLQNLLRIVDKEPEAALKAIHG